jgi:hypothetical protein
MLRVKVKNNFTENFSSIGLSDQKLKRQTRSCLSFCTRLYELQQEGKIAFLDLWIHRSQDGNIMFDIYRKPMQVPLYIPADSCHPQQHKMASFEAMAYRLVNTPLEQESFDKEKKYILEAATINGYKQDRVLNILEKHQRRKDQKDLTTLIPIKREPLKLTSGQKEKIVFTELPFMPPLSYKVEKCLKSHGINTFYSSQGNMKDLIGPLKDKITSEEKSGIYEIKCEGCDSVYVGQTKRKLITRYKEHDAALRKNQPSKSAIAQHCIEESHKIGPIKLLKEVRRTQQLDAWESLFISRAGEKLVNIENAPISSPLFSANRIP